MENIKDLETLTETVLHEHSYAYKTFSEAKSGIKVPETDMVLTYDRLSLFVYSHNLSNEGFRYFKHKLSEYFKAPHKREDLKAIKEYGTLLKLFNNCQSFDGYMIEKAVRPDFVLTGERKIGIEVTELTTQSDSVLDCICHETFGQRKTADAIHASALSKHGKKANSYTYETICGSTVVSSGLQDINYNKDIYADEIVTKFHKYANMISCFDEFIILCDAEKPLGVTSNRDTKDIIDRVKGKCPTIAGVTVYILYMDSDESYAFKAERFEF